MPLTSDQLAALPTPAGWRLIRKPTLKTAGYVAVDQAQALSNRNAAQRLVDLAQWARDHSLGLRRQIAAPAGHERETTCTFISIDYYDLKFPLVWKVVANKPELVDNALGSSTCFCGQKVLSFADPVCANCARVYCDQCGFGFLKLFKIENSHRAPVMICAECTKGCKRKKGCEGRTFKESICALCTPRFTCISCFRTTEDDGKAVVISDDNNREYLRYRYERHYGVHTPKGDLRVCSSCATAATCKSCKKIDFTVIIDKGECALCADAAIEKERGKYEAFPKDWIPRHGSMTIPSAAFRPFRTISYEMELDGDGELVARTLYRCGLVPLSKVAGYQHYPDDKNAEFPCFMKHDGSVSAGEIIAYLLNLDDQAHADALLNTCRVAHSLIQMNKASIGPRCGGHIHADAHNFSYGDVWRLLTLFNYIEDPLYRIAGAGSPTGHRSLDPKNKEHNGEGYTNSPVKGPFGTKGALGRSIQGQRRNSGLNFTPYISAAQMCECGSMAYEDSKNCKCNLGKSTIEWRIFNSTVNPRILHAWIAVVQAMMAWSEGDEDPTPEWEKGYEPVPWAARSFGRLAAATKDTVRNRVEWMFRNLPLTEDERDSLAYAVEQSDIDMAGVDLRAIIPLNDFPHKKAPRNPARRKRAIRTEAPTPGTPEPKNAFVGRGRLRAPRVRFRAPVNPGVTQDQPGFITYNNEPGRR